VVKAEKKQLEVHKKACIDIRTLTVRPGIWRQFPTIWRISMTGTCRWPQTSGIS